jgi:hypothetical protein
MCLILCLVLLYIRQGLLNLLLCSQKPSVVEQNESLSITPELLQISLVVLPGSLGLILDFIPQPLRDSLCGVKVLFVASFGSLDKVTGVTDTACPAVAALAPSRLLTEH